jgi:hypothetical protein
LEFLFVFTLKALTGNNPLPKFSAAEFWVCYAVVPQIPSADSCHTQSAFVGLRNEESHLQEAIDGALQHLGPLLAQALIYNIGGHAARSELDRLSEPLKKLVVRQVHSKRWLEAALLGDDFPSDKVTVAQRKVFLQRVMRYAQAISSYDVPDANILLAVFVGLEELIRLFATSGWPLVDLTSPMPPESTFRYRK